MISNLQTFYNYWLIKNTKVYLVAFLFLNCESSPRDRKNSIKLLSRDLKYFDNACHLTFAKELLSCFVLIACLCFLMYLSNFHWSCMCRICGYMWWSNLLACKSFLIHRILNKQKIMQCHETGIICVITNTLSEHKLALFMVMVIV